MPNENNSWSHIIINELFSLCSWLYYMLLKPVVFIGIIAAIIYALYVYFICQSVVCFVPLMCCFCPHKLPAPIPYPPRPPANIPPINAVAQQTAYVVNVLTNTEVGASRRLVAIQTILAEIDSRIQFSNIDETVKKELKPQLEDLDKLIENGIEELIQMHTTMGSALDNIKIHTEHTYEDLIRVLKGEKSHFGSKRIGEPQTETEKMNALFDDYVESMYTELDQIALDITTAKTTLEQIRKKLKTIQNLYTQGKDVSERNIDDLKYGNIWRRIFGGDSLNIERQQRAIQTLEEFCNFNKLFLNNVGDIIVIVNEYKAKIKQLRKTRISPDAQGFKLKVYLEQIEKAVTQLTKSKEEFDAKIKRSKQQEKIEM